MASMSTAEQSIGGRSFSLSQMLWWLAYCSAYFALLGSYRAFADPMFQHKAPELWRSVTPVVCWLILLWYFARRRHFAAIVVHTFPLALLLVLFAVLRDITATGDMFSLVVGTLYCSAAVSFPLSVVKSSGRSLQRELSPWNYLLLNAAGAALVMAVLCAAAPLVAGGFLQWRSAVFGATFGAWIGLHQAAATSQDVARMRWLGMPLRPLVFAGFLLGVFGTIVYWIGSNYYFPPFDWLPQWLSPLILGLPAALVGGLVGRWRSRAAVGE